MLQLQLMKVISLVLKTVRDKMQMTFFRFWVQNCNCCWVLKLRTLGTISKSAPVTVTFHLPLYYQSHVCRWPVRILVLRFKFTVFYHFWWRNTFVSTFDPRALLISPLLFHMSMLPSYFLFLLRRKIQRQIIRLRFSFLL